MDLTKAFAIIGFALLVLLLIGLFVRIFMPGYVSLEHRGKPLWRNLWENAIGLIKVFFP